MTENEVIKALRFCHNHTSKGTGCNGCPLYVGNGKSNMECFEVEVIAADMLEMKQKVVETLQWQIANAYTHAQWVNYDNFLDVYHCSKCKQTNGKRTRYCPNCGAVMDVEV